MKAKLIFLILILLVLTRSNVESAQINQQTALQIAQNFVNKGMRLSDTTPKLELVYVATSGRNINRSGNNQTVYYYVYNINEDDGFVIISGDDAAIPVLGYSTTGKYTTENQPPAFAYRMEYLEKEIRFAILQNLVPDDRTKALWNIHSNGQLQLRESLSVGPLLQTYWGQSEPYYNLCPEINGNKTVTGCVATAMAQVMKYYNHPVKGTGSSEKYITRTGIEMPAVSFEEIYQWDKMKDFYMGKNRTDPEDAVATLMYHCGVSIKMNYDLWIYGGSGSTLINAARVMPRYFGYDKSIQIRYRRFYDDEGWNALLKNEIDNNRPVLYSGRNATSGHTFICDGYNEFGLFHFNWGLNGLHNGYYATTALNPGSRITSESSGSYNLYQSVLINIMPDTGGNPPEPEMKICPARDIISNRLSVIRNQFFRVTVPVMNAGVTDFTGYIGIAMVDSEDNIQKIIGQREEPVTVEGSQRFLYGFPVNCRFPTSASPGNNTIRAVVKQLDGDWAVLKGQAGFITNKLEIEVKGEALAQMKEQESSIPERKILSNE